VQVFIFRIRILETQEKEKITVGELRRFVADLWASVGVAREGYFETGPEGPELED
jgi:hypothetical protein